jgi:hypothetical protein
MGIDVSGIFENANAKKIDLTPITFSIGEGRCPNEATGVSGG